MVPEALRPLAKKIAALEPSQKFNAVFIQRYETDACVQRHRDPKSNIGMTLIYVAGEFTGAETTIWIDGRRERFSLASGDALSLEATIGGIQGPEHEVSAVESGTRYALILNTVR